MTAAELRLLEGPIYQDAIATAYRLTKNRERAKDLAQEAYLLAYRRQHTFQSGSNLKGWMRKITYNTFLTHYRRQQKRSAMLLTKSPGETWLSTKTTDNVGAHELHLQDLLRIIEEVPPIFRTSFLLHYRGMSYEKIALRLNIPIGTVKSRIFTARTMLRAAIAKHYGSHQIAHS